MTLMLVRMLLIGAVVVGIAVLVAVVVVLAKRAGRLDDARRAAAPLARAAAARQGTLGAIGRGAAHYLEKDRLEKDQQR